MSASVAKELISNFKEILIHKDSESSELVSRLRDLFPPEIIRVIDKKPQPKSKGKLSAEEFSHSKRTIYVEPHRGHFFKKCPGAKPGLVCCNYFVLNLGLQCNMNCSYCYLQSYLNTPNMTLYSNIEDALNELRELGDKYGDKHYRVGTGETIDSLSLDSITLNSVKLIEFFKDYPKWTVEFKTKSASVDQFLDTPHSGNVLVSWSLNPQHIIDKEEHGTASLMDRLKAARRCLDKGFKVTFHFDPMIYHPDWRENYGELVNEITSQFSPDEIDILSVGALRFVSEQRQLMKERFGFDSYVTTAEVLPSSTGKLRYDTSVRKEMFQFMLSKFKESNPRWRISLCMESPEAWALSERESPRRDNDIKEIFEPLPKSVSRERSIERPVATSVDTSQY